MNLLSEKQMQQTLLLAEHVARQVMKFYHKGLEITIKSDDSPVTQADLIASQLLEKGLEDIAEFPVLSEENVPENNTWQQWETYWLIDPIDGTKHFINGTGEFCICIALIHQGKAVMGLIYAPTKNTAWLGQHEDDVVMKWHNAQLQALSVSQETTFNVMLSASYLSGKMADFLSPLPDYQWRTRGSALKYIAIVEGEAELYPKLWDTCEWDSAAGQCLLEIIGGQVLCLDDGKPLRYGQRETLINPYFIAFNRLDAVVVTQLLEQYQHLKATQQLKRC